ncbi:peptidylprolyl isomerase [Roseospira goensis]|uniref:Parvulin-like PPIase n=1 Tax=Roseospira goensis TaxID=391922 RepID=A0A7W6WKY1_9PROT|nr:peptidylprolyl isomerase [Roseospira goensis]MBB4286545.1 peptidyl-prolyl cis-trans isomerase C [Roseospira goensis]
MVRTAPRALALAAGLSLAVLASPSLAPAQQQIDPDTVVATVNGHDITMAELQAVRARDPQLSQVPLAMLYDSLVNHLVEGRLIVDKAKTEGYADHPDVAERLNAVRDEIIRSVYLTNVVEEAASEEALQARYEAYKAENPPQEEVKASHILVDTEEEARALIGQLEDGADFAELAKAESTGPSAPNGGDLGYFKREGQMVEPFAKAAFDLEAGAYTTEPVKTQFGWHVIKVTDRRTAEPASLDEVRNQLTTEIAQETIAGLVEDLRGEADIKTTPIEDIAPQAE